MLQQQTSDPSAAIAIDCFLVLREAKLFEVFPPLQWNSSQIAQLQRCRAELVKTLVDVPHLSLHYYLGLTLMALGESDAAKHLLRAIELNPVWPSLYLALVHVYWRQNQKQKAFEVMAQMARISPRAAALARSLFSYLQPPTTNKQQSQSP
jgi:tetratricopeptide (TPR) repeat protein